MVTCLAVSRVLATTALGLLALSCGDEGAGPTPAGGVRSVTITGPDHVEPGTSVQYAATLRMDDGTEQQVSTVNWTAPRVVWASSSPAVLTVNQQGRATASTTFGASTISAIVSIPGRNNSPPGSREILVLPRGTFRLAGQVTDAELVGRGIPFVVVEVRGSADLAAPVVTSTSTNADGMFTLYGVPAAGVLHLRREGYRTVAEPYAIDRHSTRNFQLQVGEGTRLSLEGTYAMNVDATRCFPIGALPASLQHRQYTAVATQSGPQVLFTLIEPAFHSSPDGRGGSFTGTVNALSVDVRLTGFYDFYYYPTYPESPDVAELLPDGSTLVVNGRATLISRANQLSGTLSGRMTQYARPSFPAVRWMSGCGEPRITLTKR